MARCDEGYRCSFCGKDVEAITDSALYLRYIIGDILLENLHLHPESHVRCDLNLAQYIIHPGFDSVKCPGPWDKSTLDFEFVKAEETRVSQGFIRLLSIPTLRLSVPEYPLSVTPFKE